MVKAPPNMEPSRLLHDCTICKKKYQNLDFFDDDMNCLYCQRDVLGRTNIVGIEQHSK
jgi:hypothetical protein